MRSARRKQNNACAKARGALIVQRETPAELDRGNKSDNAWRVCQATLRKLTGRRRGRG